MDLARHMDMLMNMVGDLANKVNGMGQAEQGMSTVTPSSALVPPHDPKTNTQPSLDTELQKTVCRLVERRLCQIPLLQGTTSQEDSDSDEEPVVKRKKKP